MTSTLPAAGVLGLLLLCAGCLAPQPLPPDPIPPDGRAGAPVVHRVLCRTRLDDARALPRGTFYPLCPEFTLVTIRRPADWQALQLHLGLDLDRTRCDLERGMIIGVLGNLGECCSTHSPLRIRAVRSYDGLAVVETSVADGLYHPVRTAAYLELVYVPGIRSVGMLRIADRTFVFRNDAGAM
jgi:hypothetical protein